MLFLLLTKGQLQQGGKGENDAFCQNVQSAAKSLNYSHFFSLFLAKEQTTDGVSSSAKEVHFDFPTTVFVCHFCVHLTT